MKLISKIALKILKFSYPFKILGKENMPEGGAVVVCNHLKFIDPLFLYYATDKNGSFIAKKELFDKKLIGWIIKDFGAVPINRENPDIRELLTCVKTLKSNKKLVIFPEGTRNKTKTDKLQEIKGGAGVFALKAKVPVVPVMILKKPKLFRKTKLLVGKPFTLEEFENQKLTDNVVSKIDAVITQKMLEVQAELKSITKKAK